MRRLWIICALLLLEGVEQSSSTCAAVSKLPPWRIFNEEASGINNTAAAMGINIDELYAKVDMTDCVSAGDVRGWSYIPYAAGTFQAMLWADDLVGGLNFKGEHEIVVSAASTEPQYSCMAAPTTVPDNTRFGVRYTAGTLPSVTRVYAYETTVQYPCGEILTKANAHQVFSMDIGTTAPTADSTTIGYTGAAGSLAPTVSSPVMDGRTHFMELALRPIMDTDFVFTCGCGAHSDCNVNDCNMICGGSSTCECKTGYVYNGEHQKCVYGGWVSGKTAFFNSPVDVGMAPLGIDGDFTTCMKSSDIADPWYVIDLESEVDVYAVSIKIPQPTDTAAKYWTMGSANTAIDAPDGQLYSIQNTVSATVELLMVSGPWPWLVTSSTLADTAVVNRDLAASGGTYTSAADFGTVGSSIGNIDRLVHVGYIKSGTDCIVVDASNVVTSAASGCTVFYILGDSTSGFIIKKLQEPNSDLDLAFTGTTPGDAASMGAGSTTFQFHNGGNVAITSLDTALGASFSLAPTTVLITPLCVALTGGAVVLSGTCNPPALTFEYHENLSSGDVYIYKEATSTAGGTGTHDFGTSTPAATWGVKPCIEVASTIIPGGGAVILETSTTEVNIDGYTMQDPILDQAAMTLVARGNIVGIRDFTVGVGNTFDGTTFNAADFAECVSYPGYPIHGDVTVNQFTCTTPQKGRYVAVYATFAPASAMSLCDVNVLVATAPGIGALCEKDADCECGTDVSDQHMHCNTSSSLCACMGGYYYWEASKRCVNYDECLDVADHTCEAPTTGPGFENGTCVDLPGNYKCECIDGMEWDTVNGGCIDIYECAVPKTDPNYHQCDQTCTDTPGSYTCGCTDGYYLGTDAVSCIDIDECDAGQRSTHGVTDYNCVNQLPFTLPGFVGLVAEPTCVNTAPGYKCGCPEGYEFIPEPSSRCFDMDECGVGFNGGCQQQCDNKNLITDGITHQCSCPDAGYKLADDKKTCIDIDECVVGTDDCGTSPNAMDSLEAEVAGECGNTIGSYVCRCPRGYEWNETTSTCQDIDECMMLSPCMHKCTNQNGGYECICDDGFNLLGDKRSCQDIDECAMGTSGCGQLCNNQLGTFTCSCNMGYMLNADGKACDVGRMLRTRLCLEMDWNDSLAALSNPDTASVADDIEDQVLDIMNDQSEIARTGNFDYDVTSFYPCEGNKVGVDVLALPGPDVSDAQLGAFAADMSNALQLQPFTLKGQQVPLVSNPEFLYVDGVSSEPFHVDGPCDYFDNTDYCQNEGVCVTVAGLPECRCKNYNGPRCLDSNTLGLTDTEIGLIAGFASLFLIFTILGCCLCCMMNRLNKPQQPREYFDDNTPSVILADRPAYAYQQGYGDRYGYGGYK